MAFIDSLYNPIGAIAKDKTSHDNINLRERLIVYFVSVVMHAGWNRLQFLFFFTSYTVRIASRLKKT